MKPWIKAFFMACLIVLITYVMIKIMSFMSMTAIFITFGVIWFVGVMIWFRYTTFNK